MILVDFNGDGRIDGDEIALSLAMSETLEAEKDSSDDDGE